MMSAANAELILGAIDFVSRILQVRTLDVEPRYKLRHRAKAMLCSNFRTSQSRLRWIVNPSVRLLSSRSRHFCNAFVESNLESRSLCVKRPQNTVAEPFGHNSASL